MMISFDRKTLVFIFPLLFSQILFSQDADRRVIRCSSVSRSAPIHNIFVQADNTRWVASGTAVFQVMGSDLSTPLGLSPGEKSALNFRGGNADVRWTADILQMTLGTAPEISTAWYDERNDWLWLGTKESGLFQLKTKPALKLVENFTSSNSKLKSNTITAVFQDRNGKYWIGTDYGMMTGTPDKWKSELDGYDVQRVRQAGPDIWVLADGEFWAVRNGDKWEAVNIKEKALEGEAEDFDLSPNGNLWILSRMVSRYDLETDEFEVYSGAEYYTSEYGRCIAADLDGAVWIGTEDKGLYLIDRTSSLIVNCLVDKELSCAGNGQDAALKVRIEGGKAPYAYAWSATGLSGDTPGNLAAGTYTVTVTDSNGKTKAAKAKIEDPRFTLTVQQKKVESGPGKKDGAAEVTIKGGTPEFKYKWDNGETANPAKKLTEGLHSVTVTDKNGCSASASTTIGQNVEALKANIEETTPIPCAGGNTILQVIVEGGKEPYQYEWSNPRLDGDQPTGVTAGTYTLTIVDAAGGKTTTSITLVQPAALSAIGTVQRSASTGNSDGKAAAQARGGSSPYTYRWDNGETSETAERLKPGTHTVTITDVNGCTITANVQITEDILPLTASIEETAKITCNGGQSALKVNVNGGKSPFEFQWSNPGLNGYQPSGVQAGTYTVTVVDAAGGKTTAVYTLRQPDPVSASATVQTPASTGNSDGIALAQGKGGSGSYQFRWDNGETADRAIKLGPGVHIFTVTDEFGCSATAAITVAENILPLSVNLEEKSSIACAGGHASLHAVVSGGKGPFRFQWSNASLQSDQFDAALAGTHAITVTDAAGGQATATIQVKQPAPVEVTASVKAAASTGNNDGKATVKVSGGAAPYLFRWDNEETAEAANRLSPGTHGVTVTDDNGCTATTTVDITENILPLSVNIEETGKINCNGGQTSLNAIVSGGKSPFQFQWNNATLAGSQPTSVPAGEYTLIVIDAAGNRATTAFKVRQPDPLTASTSVQAPASAGNSDGKATVKASGGTKPYLLRWDNGETTEAANGLSPGAHNVTVTDANNCTATATVNISENILPMEVNVEETGDIKCAGGTSGLKVTVTGGKPPFQYKWDNPAWSGNTIANVPAATYAVLVTDATGTTQTAVAIVNQPDPLDVEITRVVGATTERSEDGKATVKIKGGTPPLTIAWNNGETATTAARLNLGNHSVTVTDANGCTLTKPVEIKKRILPELNAAMLKNGQTIKMEQLRFEADSSSLTDDALPTLDELFDFMEENGDVVIEIGGHTNSTPPDEFCDRLSTARAKSAAEYLISKGVDAKRVVYKGYGKRQPIASNATAEGRRQNQRVEIKILTLKRQ